MSDRLHRIHAAPSEKGNRVDIGVVAWRGEGGDWEAKRATSRRIAVCWNIAEGWPTAALEAGVLRDVDEAARDLLEAFGADPLGPAAEAAAARLRAAFAKRDPQQDLTNGRPHDCAGCLAKEAAALDGPDADDVSTDDEDCA